MAIVRRDSTGSLLLSAESSLGALFEFILYFIPKAPRRARIVTNKFIHVAFETVDLCPQEIFS